MALLDNAEIVDAKRFEVIAHATVMTSGRLRFATDAMEMMELNDDKIKGIILFSLNSRRMPDDDTEFLAVTCPEIDPRAFTLKASGPYKYISLKNFFIQQGINFKDYSTTFEVTEVNEKYEDTKSVYRLTMRQTPKPHEVERLQKEEEQNGVADIPF